MKKWVEKFIEQFDWDSSGEGRSEHFKISEERATLLYIIDSYSKYLIEVEGHPIRQVRESLDQFARDFLNPEEKNIDRDLFRFRQFFTKYRIDETSYVQKTFEDFRSIIWDFVDQLSEDFVADRQEDDEIQENFNELKDAVESNSIDLLKSQSRKFIDSYVEHSFKKEKRQTSRVKKLNQNLSAVKKQLDDAEASARKDHLTGAYNRRSFDEHIRIQKAVYEVGQKPQCLLMMDIDHFKKINDNYGHPIGDFILKECVGMLQKIFSKEGQFVARVGGEEFAVILADTSLEEAIALSERVLQQARSSAFVQDTAKLSFTLSIGVAEILPGQSVEQWLKRADQALYASKSSGRNRLTVADSLSHQAA